MSDYIASLRADFKALILAARDRNATVEAYVMDDLRPLGTFLAEWGQERRSGQDRRKQLRRAMHRWGTGRRRGLPDRRKPTGEKR